jgi:hypothetical protein
MKLKLPYQHYVIEGIDGLGKSTLINAIKNADGFFHYIHYEKPQALDVYDNDLFTYQSNSFQYGFELLEQQIVPFIFDRFHLGELVYAHRYRGYDGEYVFSMERDYKVEKWSHVKLILLVTSNWSHIVDDGLSFDFSAKEQEQEDFIRAIQQSQFPRRQIIDICHKDGRRKTPQELLEEIS